MKNRHARTRIPLSRFERHCAGATDSDHYVVVINVAAASVPRTGDGQTDALDGIVAFDLAEVRNMGMGQLNLIQVSSFCGPDGLIWGYDLARPDGLRSRGFGTMTDDSGRHVPIYDAAPLIEAGKALVGTAENPSFPIRPGSLCPAAYKSAVLAEPGVVYAGFALGVVEDRASSACIFMENCGSFGSRGLGSGVSRRLKITRNLAGSVLAVAANQRVRCKEVFVAYDEVCVSSGEVGCALATVPYIRLARGAVPSGPRHDLRDLSLTQWQSLVSPGRKRRP